MDIITQFVVQHLIGTTSALIMPLMLAAFTLGVIVRVTMYYYARVQNHLALEFEKRVRASLEQSWKGEVPPPRSFQVFVSEMLNKTFFECFEVRSRYKRRNFDHVTSVMDRLFLFNDAAKRANDDMARLVRYLKRENTGHTRMLDVAKTVFDTNPYFNKLIGVVPMNLLNELTNILPGLFIVGGIFGTFLGISKGLPELGAMDLARMEETKHIMDAFLVTISQSMVKSIVGIFLSVAMSLINTFFAPEVMYYNAVNRFAGVLDMAWNETATNDAPIMQMAPDRDTEITKAA